MHSTRAITSMYCVSVSEQPKAGIEMVRGVQRLVSESPGCTVVVTTSLTVCAAVNPVPSRYLSTEQSSMTTLPRATPRPRAGKWNVTSPVKETGPVAVKVPGTDTGPFMVTSPLKVEVPATVRVLVDDRIRFPLTVTVLLKVAAFWTIRNDVVIPCEAVRIAPVTVTSPLKVLVPVQMLSPKV